MYTIIAAPLVAAIIAQILKILLQPTRAMTWKMLLSYSGMPSGHTAMVVALATTIGFEVGWQSPLFGFACVFALIVIRDAAGLRGYLGLNGKLLNDIIHDLKKDHLLRKRYPHLVEHLGHTPLQITMGALIGLATSLAAYALVS